MSGDTIIRAPKRRVRSRGRDRLPCYCLDRCHHMDIGVSPMFRPFSWSPDLGEGHCIHDLDLEPSRDNFKVEIVKADERIVRGASAVSRYSTSEVSSFRKDGHTYYRLRHGDEYQVRMTNNTSEHVNAMLKIDSDTMGKWRLKPYQTVMIERPAHNSRKFVFVKEVSDEAREGGVRQGAKSGANGLVEVTFIPMIDRRPDSMKQKAYPLTNSNSMNNQSFSYSNSNSNAMMNSRGLGAEYAKNSVTESDSFGLQKQTTYESGATVLGDDSSQKFGQASRYFVEDKSRKIVKRVRLVIDNRGKYASIRDKDDGYDEGRYDDPVPPKIRY